MNIKKISFLLIIIAFTGCETQKTAKVRLEKKSYSSLKGWEKDNHKEALKSLSKSCEIVKKDRYSNKSTLDLSTSDLKKSCKRMPNNINDITDKEARKYFEKNFDAYLVKSPQGEKRGTFTGYYQPYLKGSYTKTDVYDEPILTYPGKEYASKTREQIRKGALSGKSKTLYWTDPYDLFHLQVQGSGILILPDGKQVAISYGGNNGHPFKGMGKILMDKNIKPAKGYSENSVKQWCHENKSLAKKYALENKRYVFFRENNTLGAIGAQGVELTDKRSLAVDTSYIPLGLPLFLNTRVSGKDFNNLVIAQDTGKAIVGAVRGDIYFGTGNEALEVAGRQKESGQYYILLPRGRNYK